MPRTPFFSVLLRLARHSANSTQRPRDDGSTEIPSPGRRRFLTGAAAVSAATALAGIARNVPTRKLAGPASLLSDVVGTIPHAGSPARIAIVGAGISGLTAALALHDAGYATDVYEASSRSGGRIHTNRAGWFGDATAEWCGELIDTDHLTMLALAKRFGLELTDVLAAVPRGAQYTLQFNGAYYTIDDAARDFVPVLAQLRAQLRAAGDLVAYDQLTDEQRRLDAMSVHAWIERYVPGGHASRMGTYIERAYLAEFGRDTREQSAINLVYMLGTQAGPVEGEAGFHIFGPSDERYHIRGGNERLTDAIVAHLPPGTIRLDTPLVAIARAADGPVTLALATHTGRETRTYDRVIITIPFTRLRHVDLHAARLSTVKRRAIAELGYARHTKMHVPFDRRYWNAPGPWPGISDGTVYTDLNFQNTWDTTRGQPGRAGILVAYLGGAPAVAAAADTAYSTTFESPKTRTAIDAFVAQLDRVYPGIAKQYAGHGTMGSAFLDPFIGGSYSVWLVGQVTAFGGAEGRAEGNLHFAGEHTSLDQQGYMEGGAATGMRAAHEVLHALART